MCIKSIKHAKTYLGALIGLAVLGGAPASAAPCGPGPNWVNPMNPDCLGTDILAGDIIITLLVIGNPIPITVDIGTTSTVTKMDSGVAGRINTNISVTTRAPVTVPGLGSVSISEMLSPGMIIQKTGPTTPNCMEPANPLLACSYFDINNVVINTNFGPLTAPSLQSVPIRMFAEITQVPPLPLTLYQSISGVPETLVNDANVPVAQIINVTHEIKPEPATLMLFGTGLGLLAIARTRRRRRG